MQQHSSNSKKGSHTPSKSGQTDPKKQSLFAPPPFFNEEAGGEVDLHTPSNGLFDYKNVGEPVYPDQEKDSAQTLHRANKDGSGVWGADRDDRGLDDYAKRALLETAAELALLKGWANASKHMIHYLFNTGDDLVVDVDQLMQDEPTIAAAFDIEENMAVAEASERIDTIQNLSGPFNFQLRGNQGGMSPSSGGDWYYAIGLFHYFYTATVSVKPISNRAVSVSMTFEINFVDRYNWDEGKEAYVLGLLVKDEEIGELHRVGLAQEYDMIGKSTPKQIEWTHTLGSGSGASPRLNYPESGGGSGIQR